jgi:hypothetical protein
MAGKLLHRIAHILGWNEGYVVSALDDKGLVWIAFKCATCGDVSGREVSHISNPPPKIDEFN